MRLDPLQLTDLGDDRVRFTGIRGEAPPPELKVSVNEIGGYRQEIVFMLTGLNAEEKAALIQAQYEHALELEGLPRPASMKWTLVRSDQPDSPVQETATARLTLVARDSNPKVVGRAFANVSIEIALGSVPGLFYGGPPTDANVYGRYRPMYVAQEVPVHTVHLADGEKIVIEAPAETRALEPTEFDARSEPVGRAAVGENGAVDDTVRIALGEVFGARSGDKGGTANIGVWARSDEGWQWLQRELTADRLRELLPEMAPLAIDRTELPNFRALNFVVHGLLVEGVAYGARFDAQAKGLGEWLRSRTAEVPAELAAQHGLDDFFAEARPAS